MRFSVTRALALAFFTLLLAGCVAKNEPGALATIEYQFSPAHPDGMVIASTQAAQDTRTGWLNKAPSWVAIWSKVDPRTLRFVEPHVDLRLEHAGCAFIDYPMGCVDDPRVPRYVPMLAEPGHYALRQINYSFIHTTVFATNPQSPLIETTLPHLLSKGELPWFEVKAGEIVYIGDYIFNIEKSPIRLQRIERSDGALQRARSMMPRVTGDIRYAGPSSAVQVTNRSALREGQ